MKNENIFKAVVGTGAGLFILGCLVAAINGEFNLFSIILILIGAIGLFYSLYVKKQEFKQIITNRATRYGINAFIYSLLFIGIIAFIQAIFSIHSLQFDLTKSKKYSLSDQTKKVLTSLKNNVDIYYFYSVQARNIQIEDTLRQYEKMSPKIKFQSIDADRNPALAKRFNINKYGTIALNRKDNDAVERVEELTEQAITNALIRISKNEKKKIYFTKGHGEPSIEAPQNEKNGLSVIKKEIENENYQVSEIELFNSTGVPDDCSILVISGPQVDLFDTEVKYIKKYINKGGNIIFLYPAFSKLPKLESILKEVGIEPDNDVIVDKFSRMLGGDFLMPIISQYESHDITRSFGIATFFPMCRSFEIKTGINGITVQAIAKTNPGSWGETDLNGIKRGQAGFSEKDDKKSPLTVMAISNIDNSIFKADSDLNTNNTKAKIVVFGSSEFINNTYLSVSGNRDLILNTISFLAQQGELISIRAKDKSFEPLFMSKIQGRMLFIIPTVFLPLLVLAIAIMVFVRRRMGY